MQVDSIRLDPLLQWNAGSTQPEVKSAPESSRPWVYSARCIFRAFSYIYDLWFVLHNLLD